MKMEGDSDYGEDGDPDFSWPSQLLDIGREEARHLQEAQDTDERVKHWITDQE